MQQVTKNQIKYITRIKNNALFRKKEGKVYIEGEHNVLELIQNRPNLIETVLKREDATRYSQLNSISNKVFEINKIQSKKLSYGKKPFILATLIDIKNVAYKNDDFSSGLFIGLVNVQDPFNLGTIFRTAQAFGVSGILLFDNCVNPFNQKAVISSTGSVFKVPFYTFDSVVEFINKNKCIDIYGTAVPKKSLQVIMEGEKLPTESDKLTTYTNLNIQNGIILFGNEGTGLSSKVLKLTKQNLYIPIKTDSLNVAVSVAVIVAKLTQD